MFKRGELWFMVAVTPSGTCSALFRDVLPQQLQKLVEQHYQLAKPHIEASGPQINTIYRFVGPSAYVGGYIMLTASKPGFGADGLSSLGFIPAKVVANMRENSGK